MTASGGISRGAAGVLRAAADAGRDNCLAKLFYKIEEKRPCLAGVSLQGEEPGPEAARRWSDPLPVSPALGTATTLPRARSVQLRDPGGAAPVSKEWSSKFHGQLLLSCKSPQGRATQCCEGLGAPKTQSQSCQHPAAPGPPEETRVSLAISRASKAPPAGAPGKKTNPRQPQAFPALSHVAASGLGIFEFALFYPFPSRAGPSPNGNKDEIF
ncbi:uncharacterized protein LOC134044452 [Cinclus cinclus]|uniref:uncharacterized protein LOC134044452 n=1 Tax=Cinclus cinclus TaxID=127875 RepID=UPI002E0D65A6